VKVKKGEEKLKLTDYSNNISIHQTDISIYDPAIKENKIK